MRADGRSRTIGASSSSDAWPPAISAACFAAAELAVARRFACVKATIPMMSSQQAPTAR